MVSKSGFLAATIVTGVQGLYFFMLSCLALAHYFCAVDFLKDYSVLTFIKILYFFNPTCGKYNNIGITVDGIPDKAYVVISEEPLPTTKYFYISCVNLAVSFFLTIASGFVMANAGNITRNSRIRRFWIITNMCTCAVITVATISLINDTFYIHKLENTSIYLGARFVGVGKADVDMSWGAWFMVLMHSGGGAFYIINVVMVVIVTDWTNSPPTKDQERKSIINNHNMHQPQTKPVNDFITYVNKRWKGDQHQIPRVRNFDTRIEMPAENPVPSTFSRKSLEPVKSVRFPENPVSCIHVYYVPESASSNITAVLTDSLGKIKTAGSARTTKLKLSQSMDLRGSNLPTEFKTIKYQPANLQGQKPWAYFLTPSMRAQLSSDEDMPSLPVPDYKVKRNKTFMRLGALPTYFY